MPAKKPKRPRTLEASIQKAVVSWCRTHENALYHDIFHIANEGNMTKGEACKRKRQGILAGVMDLCLVLPRGRTLWLELKTKKGRLSKVQNKRIKDWQALGHNVHVAYGYTEAIAVLEGVVNNETR